MGWAINAGDAGNKLKIWLLWQKSSAYMCAGVDLVIKRLTDKGTIGAGIVGIVHASDIAICKVKEWLLRK